MRVSAALLLIFGLLLGSFYYFSGTQETVIVTIESKERVTFGSGDTLSHKYMIFTDKEVFENTDTIWALKYNSADIYGKLKAGDQCTMLVYGWRMPFFSMYRNIITAVCSSG